MFGCRVGFFDMQLSLEGNVMYVDALYRGEGERQRDMETEREERKESKGACVCV